MFKGHPRSLIIPGFSQYGRTLRLLYNVINLCTLSAGKVRINSRKDKPYLQYIPCICIFPPSFWRYHCRQISGLWQSYFCWHCSYVLRLSAACTSQSAKHYGIYDDVLSSCSYINGNRTL